MPAISRVAFCQWRGVIRASVCRPNFIYNNILENIMKHIEKGDSRTLERETCHGVGTAADEINVIINEPAA